MTCPSRSASGLKMREVLCFEMSISRQLTSRPMSINIWRKGGRSRCWWDGAWRFPLYGDIEIKDLKFFTAETSQVPLAYKGSKGTDCSHSLSVHDCWRNRFAQTHPLTVCLQSMCWSLHRMSYPSIGLRESARARRELNLLERGHRSTICVRFSAEVLH